MEKCTITITMDDSIGAGREEDFVKQVWTYMVPFFTRRHGVQKGKIDLNDNVHIEWAYETIPAAGESDIPF